MKNLSGTCLAMIMTFFFTTKGFCGDPEKLLGVSLNFDKKEITITVVTSGCTVKNDFQFILKNGELTINRKKKDECKALASEVSFTYSLAEAGIDPNQPFRILNRFIGNPFVANIK
jgi:hypothetical protein